MKDKNLYFEIKHEAPLLGWLIDNLEGRSRTTVKSYLSHRQVMVNDIVTTQFDHPLKPGDTVAIRMERMREEFRHPMLRIVYEDDDLIVIDKRNGLLSMATDKEKTKTAYHILGEYLKRDDPRNRIFIVHRLDRETSGLMLFAKSESIKETLQHNWKRLVLDRRYVAVTEGEITEREGVIRAALSENAATRKVYVDRRGEGTDATTRYRVLRAKNGRSLVELCLETGRKNQIRAHLEWIGHPIVGDKKYGAKDDSAGRVCLHAHKLSFTHPTTGRVLDFSTRIPQLFEELV